MTLNEKIQLARDEVQNAIDKELSLHIDLISASNEVREAFSRLSKLLTELDEQEHNEND